MRLLAFASVVSLSVASFACGETPPANSPVDAPSSRATAPSTTAAVVIEKTTSLKRSQVKATIVKGLGYFLQNVTVEDYPVMRGGKFYGFKIKNMNAELGVDLGPRGLQGAEIGDQRLRAGVENTSRELRLDERIEQRRKDTQFLADRVGPLHEHLQHAILGSLREHEEMAPDNVGAL